jgi:hypothetical protein
LSRNDSLASADGCSACGDGIVGFMLDDLCRRADAHSVGPQVLNGWMCRLPSEVVDAWKATNARALHRILEFTQMDRATDALHLRPILQIIPMHKRQPTETIAAAASLPESPGEAMRGEDG